MKNFEIIAIPLWGNSVAPRFGCADQFLIVPVGNRSIGESQTISIGEQLNWTERLSRLREYDVNVLVCGGFNSRFVPLATRLGLLVKCGVSGHVAEVVKQYSNGTLKYSDTCLEKKAHKGRQRCTCPNNN